MTLPHELIGFVITVIGAFMIVNSVYKEKISLYGFALAVFVFIIGGFIWSWIVGLLFLILLFAALKISDPAIRRA
jgi:hypothetical protein